MDSPATVGGLEIRGVRKAYGNTQALAGLDLVVRPGEITGIAGPNGAGKSTLVRILAGETTADSGEIWFDGQLCTGGQVDLAAVVHQEPQLFENLTVGENLLVGRETTTLRRPGVGGRELILLDEVGLAKHADQVLGRCSVAIRQKTEIARALDEKARIFLFDEPNSALTAAESEELFRHMRAIAAQDHVVILVSHRIAELVANCTRVVIILDGRVSATLEGPQLTPQAVARELVVGQSVPIESRTGQAGTTRERLPVISVSSWTSVKGAFRAISLSVSAGEVVALYGVEGSGARELLRSLAGFEAAEGHIEGSSESVLDRSGVDFVSADRRRSLFPNLSLRDNIVARLGRPGIANDWTWLDRGAMNEIASTFVDRFGIACRSIDQPVMSLSGGNQQKVALAAAIARGPALLVLEEPTRGVDLRSKAEIYTLLRRFTEEGSAVVIFSTEVPEVFEVADHVIVVSDGRASQPLIVGAYPDVAMLAAAMTSATVARAGEDTHG